MKVETQNKATPNLQELNEETLIVEEESKGKRILNAVINGLLVVAIALAAICTYVSFVSTSGNGVPSILGIRIFSIQTESMYPTLLPGDLIFDTGVKDPGDLRNGDIITYWTVINGERVLNTHRIHEIYDGGGYLIFATKGDNNTAADALTVHESEVVGKYAGRVSGVGKVFDYLQTSTGFLIVVVIPVFIFFLFHVVQFFRVLFEYQNVKNRIKYEQERGRTEDLIAAQQKQQAQAKELERAAIEAELREKLKAELLASMGQSAAAVEAPAPKSPAKKAAPKKAAPKKPAAPKPAPKAEPAVEEAEEETPVAPAPKKKAVKKAAPAPVVEETPEPEVEEEVLEPEVEEETAVAAVEEEIVEEVSLEDETVESEVEDETVETEDDDVEYDDQDEDDFDDEDLDDDELYAGASLDDLLFGDDDEEETPEE